MSRSTETYGWRASLGNLRLVNKTFSRSASPQYYRTFKCRSLDKQALEGLRHIAHSPFASHLKVLSIGIPDILRDDDLCEDIVYWLPACIALLPNLQSLTLTLKRGTVSSSEDFLRSSTKVYAKVLESIFIRVSLPHLEELDIRVDGTYELHQLLNKCSTGSSSLRMSLLARMKTIRRLSIGLLQYTHSEPRYGLMRQYAAQSQHGHWNTEYAGSLSKILQHMDNITAFSLTCTDILKAPMHSLLRSQHLEEITLHSVEFPGDKFDDVVKANLHCLRKVELRYVELSSGTWCDVFQHMLQCTVLVDIYVSSITYSQTGESAAFRPPIWREIDNPTDIDTGNFDDLCSLGDLQRHINVNRDRFGWDPLDGYDAKRLSEMSLTESRAERAAQALHESSS